MIVLLFFNLISLSVMARDVLPLKVSPVPTVGPNLVKKDGIQWSKVSTVFEYQYSDVYPKKLKSKGDQLILEVDKSAVGFSIVIFSEGDDFAYVERLIAPTGLEVISAKPKGVDPSLLNREDVQGRGQMLSLNQVLPEVYKDISITSVPSTDRVKVTPGQWKFTIAFENENALKKNKYRVSVFVKKAEVAPEKTVGFIHMDSYITDKSGFGLAPEAFYNFLAPAQYLLEDAGLFVQLHRVNQLLNRYDETCNSHGLPCFLLSLDLMKKNNLRKNEFGILKAFFFLRNNYSDYGLANLNGSLSSLLSNPKERFGGVFTWIDPAKSLVEASKTFVHELGHHLGLYHTNSDHISDTKDFAHWIEGNQRPRGDNIMNEGAGRGPFTRGQKYVLKRAVAVELYARGLRK